MNPIRHIRRMRRFVAVLTGFGAALLMATAAPAAFAMRLPPPGGRRSALRCPRPVP
jgi:hypothetical protein